MEYPIPIQNLYYLFLYAWNRFEEGQAVDVGAVDSPELYDLFAKVLAGGLKHLLRRGVDRGYVPVQEDLSRIRGRVNFRESMELILRHAPRLNCEFDELQRDIPANQILKATASRLALVRGLDKELAHELRVLAKSFYDVTDVRLSRQLFRQVHIHRNNAFYDCLIKACELIFESTLPEGRGDGYRFTDVLRDERKMARVFEDFVRNFLRLEQSRFRVTSLALKWNAQGSDEQLKMLPIMRTDIHLENSTSRIIIDTKYYAEALQNWKGKKSLRSENLYQLFSYLKNSEAEGPQYKNAEGILLYPAVGEKIAFEAVIQGHPVRVNAINLDQPWQDIRGDLLGVVGVSEVDRAA